MLDVERAAVCSVASQSTSPNRKLSGAGAVLLRLPHGPAADAAAADAAAAASATAAVPAARPPSKKKRKLDDATPAVDGEVVRWSVLAAPLADVPEEGLDEETLVIQNDAEFHSMDCDEKVPAVRACKRG